MTPYVFLMLLICILCGRWQFLKIGNMYLASHKSISKYILAVLIIIVFAAIRYNVGWDYKSYVNIVKEYEYGLNYSKFGFFSNCIFRFAAILHKPQVVFIVFAVLIYMTLFIALYKLSDSFYESLVIYMSLFFISSLSTLRSEIAIVIVLFSFYFFKNKKWIRFFLCIAVASCFHKSAFLGLLVPIVYYLPTLFVVVFGIFEFVFSKCILPIIVFNLFPHYYTYFTDYGDAGGRYIIVVYTMILLYIVYSLFIKKKVIANSEYNKELVGLFNIFFIGICIWHSFGTHTGWRVAEYFLIFIVLLMPKIHKFYSIRFKRLYLVPFYVFFFLYLFVAREAYLPYNTVFSLCK